MPEIIKTAVYLLTTSLIISCSYIACPEEYEVIEGEYCIVVCDGTLTADQYEQICSLADGVYPVLQSEIGIQMSSKLYIHFSDLNFSGSAGAAGTESIFLDADYYTSLDAGYRIYMLRHEMTHIIFGQNFGDTTSFIFSEGIAEYYSFADSDSAAGIYDVENWIGLSYYDYFLNADEYAEISTELYSLSLSFITFWCSQYGEESLKELYPDVTAENIIEKLEDYSHNDFDEIVTDYNNYQGGRL